jgi:hypothetical protein
MYCLARRRRAGANVPRFAILPILDSYVAKIEHQFDYITFYVFPQIVDNLARIMENEWSYPLSCTMDLELSCAESFNFSFRGCYV